MSLYDIRKDIEACVDAETGEIIDAEKLASLQVERDEKISNIACWIKNLLIDIEGIKVERKKLAERQAVMEHKAASLKAYLPTSSTSSKYTSGWVRLTTESSMRFIGVAIFSIASRSLSA